MPRVVIISLTVLIVLTGLYSVVMAQTTEVPHWQEHKWREHYLQSLSQMREIDPDSFVFTALYLLNDQYVDKFISAQTGETREQVYQRLSPFSTSEFNKHTAILLESYRAGDCESTLSGQCYMLTIMLWATTDKVLIPMGTTVSWTTVTDPDYRPEWADWNIRAAASGVVATSTPILTPVSSPTPTRLTVATGEQIFAEIDRLGYAAFNDLYGKQDLRITANWNKSISGDFYYGVAEVKKPTTSPTYWGTEISGFWFFDYTTPHDGQIIVAAGAYKLFASTRTYDCTVKRVHNNTLSLRACDEVSSGSTGSGSSMETAEISDVATHSNLSEVSDMGVGSPPSPLHRTRSD